jgi:predicted O-methyltransferase YrrM
LACRHRRQKLTTFEVLPDKVRLARETFAAAGVEDLVDIIQDDARRLLAGYPQVAFCFIDAEKDIHQSCYDLVIPNLVPGGWLVADNVISHQSELQSFLSYASEDPRLDALVVPLGKGLLLCRKL